MPVESLDLATGSQPVYVSFSREDPAEYQLGSFSCLLKFVSKEVDPSSGMPEETGYDDEYQLEEVELGAGGDYIVPSYCSFESEWEKLGEAASAEEEFSLSSMASIKGTSRICQISAVRFS
jgi:coatomer protein complex subunit gamma